MGESVTEGTVSRWLKAVGDTVEADAPSYKHFTLTTDSSVHYPSSGSLLNIKPPSDEGA
ncbi:hypothetical protein [Escherichia coli]|uniref:hypothetical protein n=1 Tax=Escherichia coli TaxID=562 RepID=UPI003A599965